MGEGQRFYRNRSDDGEVILNQRQNPESTSSPGLYCCIIPDSNEFCRIYQRICINLGKFAVFYEPNHFIHILFDRLNSVTSNDSSITK
jgi:hypothetical protein